MNCPLANVKALAFLLCRCVLPELIAVMSNVIA